MSFWGRLFGTPEIVKDVTDAVVSGADKIVFTEEERSEANMARLEWFLRFHEASKGSNLARRLIAVMFTGAFLFLILMAGYLAILGFKDRSALVLDIVADTLVVPMGLIISFYFASGMVRDYVKK